MRASATFDVDAPRDRLVAFLSDPRNLLVANRDAPVVASSGPVAKGSSALMTFDQLQVRVEYTAFEPPELVEARVAYTGRGSRGMQGTYTYRLARTSSGEGTAVTLEAESTGGWTPPFVARLLWPLAWRRMRDRMAHAAAL